ncbi:tRNA 5-methylaminomethyl-2-thiouridine biosynthesis bifunctional protein [Acinetobacter calcoaceticus]|uniref:tRNA 5-methylaminomethyl-2-thiouridine biosynthesis bifunctional protein MnmC n=1 Tax=Acinetobacter calcoaceticus TaxID=471 RepID=A0A4R1XLU7_ACICA|nr:tRNA 5-methylaminomethyl-2-thiouridine biosynthesis bifunctional protein [Acinetobacter calcoaceticus]
MSTSIQTAELEWQTIDGIDVPISKQFGDVYFSKDNGLQETRHVFLAGNDLTERLSHLAAYDYFSVAETGFGTGLNILALWQLWQQQRPDNHSHLHAISVEKFPLSREDLQRALAAWPELAPLTEQLLAQYPLPIAGCHRLNFPQERFSLDLWLGDAQQVFPSMAHTHAVNAWFLDGFAPSCNPDMWEAQVLDHIVRMSAPNTTFASFSVAGVLKRGLKKHGISLSRPRGFGHKREMLKAVWLENRPDDQQPDPAKQPDAVKQPDFLEQPNAIKQPEFPKQIAKPNVSSIVQRHQPRRIAIIGAGIAGLSSAWALAQRGHQIDLYDQTAPISGASGNPMALLNPYFSNIENAAEHLMTLAWQYALPFYAQFQGFRSIAIKQMAFRHADELLDLAANYPAQMLQRQPASAQPLKTHFDCLEVSQAGTVSPQALCTQVLAHPNIQLHIAKISAIQKIEPSTAPQTTALTTSTTTTETATTSSTATTAATSKSTTAATTSETATTAVSATAYRLVTEAETQPLANTEPYDQVLVCCARSSPALFSRYAAIKPVRGQVSWMQNTQTPIATSHAYSYGGYCFQLNAEQLLLGASFYPNRDDDQVLEADHVHNYELIHNVFPAFAEALPPISQWQGRASVRAQSPDYFPLLGKVENDSEIYTFSALGSKGFLFAPLCAEVLAALMLAEQCPISQDLLNKLSAQRFFKKPRIRKPYYAGPFKKSD